MNVPRPKCLRTAMALLLAGGSLAPVQGGDLHGRHYLLHKDPCYVELPCHGYHATQWRRWPEWCPTGPQVIYEEPADAPYAAPESIRREPVDPAPRPTPAPVFPDDPSLDLPPAIEPNGEADSNLDPGFPPRPLPTDDLPSEPLPEEPLPSAPLPGEPLPSDPLPSVPLPPSGEAVPPLDDSPSGSSRRWYHDRPVATGQPSEEAAEPSMVQPVSWRVKVRLVRNDSKPAAEVADAAPTTSLRRLPEVGVTR